MVGMPTFMGGGLYRAAGHAGAIRVGQGRLQVVAGAPSGNLQLPSRLGLRPGGPYFVVVNASGSTLTLKAETGATLRTIADGHVAKVWLSPSRWVAYDGVAGASRALTLFGGRVNPVGYKPTGPVAVEDSSPDDDPCLGADGGPVDCAIGAYAVTTGGFVDSLANSTATVIRGAHSIPDPTPSWSTIDADPLLGLVTITWNATDSVWECSISPSGLATFGWRAAGAGPPACPPGGGWAFVGDPPPDCVPTLSVEPL